MNSHKPLTISQLTVSFLHKTCFEHFNATIYPSDRIALIGDNGSGKTTLLSLLAGLYKPQEGKIIIPADVIVGYLPQEVALDQNKTVWDIVTAGVEHILKKIQQFEDLAKQVGQSQALDSMYDELLEKLVRSNAFELENDIVALLQQMGLADKKFETISTLSGGQQLLVNLVRVLAARPDVLLLDEPTNHLDRTNREKLFSFLDSWQGSAVIVSHDVDLLRSWSKKIWDIRHGEIIVFDGSYDDYMRERALFDQQQMERRTALKREKKKLEFDAQYEHDRAARSSAKGQKKYANAPNVVRKAKKEQAGSTASKKAQEINRKQEEVEHHLITTHIHKKIVPRFDLSNQKHYGTISIQDGVVGYGDAKLINNINLIVQPGERIAIMGDNGMGKSTLFKAFMSDDSVKKSGIWQCPPSKNIGYLSQQYDILRSAANPFDLIKTVQPHWSDREIRAFLNDFLFCKNEEVSAHITTLSGGEKARLALAYVSAQSPSLLLLDEVTNNVDLTTRNHIIDVLNQFFGTLIVISHDYDFLRAIGIERMLCVVDGRLTEE